MRGGDGIGVAGKTFEGTCHCGRVQYQVSGPWARMTHCHCTDCQKSHGAPFATYVKVQQDRFRVLKGEDLLRSFDAPSGTRRTFCRLCGSKVTGGDEGSGGWIWIAAATLDTPPDIPPERHFFVRSKAPWHDIQDDLPQDETYPEEGP